MRVGEACNRTVVVTSPSASIVEAARLMREYHVGTLVVAEGESPAVQPVGILTDRDLVIEILAEPVVPDEVTVKDVMSGDPVTAEEDDDLLETLDRMRSGGVRRMPVVNGAGALVGILSMDDVLEVLAGAIGEVPQLIRRQQFAEERRRP